MRVGFGFDTHRFGEGAEVVIGGVKIPFSRGIVAHSDGDVLLHAICDALLGAMALGDIGQHFPDTDDNFKGCNSLDLLKKVYSLVVSSGYVLSNIDSVVVCERPKLMPHITSMRENIAIALDVSVDSISVKATTNEGLGYVGRGEGISAHAVACVMSKTLA